MFYYDDNIKQQYGELIDWQVEHILPRWVLDAMDIEVVRLEPQYGEFHLRHNPDLYRRFPPPVTEQHLCGQAVMALADTLMIFPVLAATGRTRDMATLDMSTQFLRPLQSGRAKIIAKVIKLGRTAIRGVVDLYDEHDKHCATSMVCYVHVQPSAPPNHLHKEVQS